MHSTRTTLSPADVATEVGTLSAGLGILCVALFPVAVPALLFVIAPLAVVAVAGALLVLPVVLLFWLARSIVRTVAPGSSPLAASPPTSRRLSTRRHRPLLGGRGGRTGRGGRRLRRGVD